MDEGAVITLDGRAPWGRALANAVDAREYRARIGEVVAYQAPTAFTIMTDWGQTNGRQGDYVCVSPMGAAWAVPQRLFEAEYRPA